MADDPRPIADLEDAWIVFGADGSLRLVLPPEWDAKEEEETPRHIWVAAILFEYLVAKPKEATKLLMDHYDEMERAVEEVTN